MGCTVARPFRRRFSMEICRDDGDLLKYTWFALMKQREKTGVKIYRLLLDSEREIRRLFPKIICNDKVERFTVDEEQLRHHALRVMDGIAFAVDCLDDPEKLDRFLRMVGNRHYEAEVPQDMLEKLWPALDEGFMDVLKDAYSKEARKAWHFFFHYMVNVMKIGMIEAEMRDVARGERTLTD